MSVSASKKRKDPFAFPMLVVFSFLFFSSILSFNVQASATPKVNVPEQYKNGEVNLNGEWGFYWGEWLPLEKIHSDEYQIQTIARPDYLKNLLSDNVNSSSPVVT